MSVSSESILLTIKLSNNRKYSLSSILTQQGKKDLCFVTKQASIFTIYGSEDYKDIIVNSSGVCTIGRDHLLNMSSARSSGAHCYRRGTDRRKTMCMTGEDTGKWKPL